MDRRFFYFGGGFYRWHTVRESKGRWALPGHLVHPFVHRWMAAKGHGAAIYCLAGDSHWPIACTLHLFFNLFNRLFWFFSFLFLKRIERGKRLCGSKERGQKKKWKKNKQKTWREKFPFFYISKLKHIAETACGYIGIVINRAALICS